MITNGRTNYISVQLHPQRNRQILAYVHYREFIIACTYIHTLFLYSDCQELLRIGLRAPFLLNCTYVFVRRLQCLTCKIHVVTVMICSTQCSKILELDRIKDKPYIIL